MNNVCEFVERMKSLGPDLVLQSKLRGPGYDQMCFHALGRSKELQNANAECCTRRPRNGDYDAVCHLDSF
jgi:hypothetical protein